jgi:hypothetical protein
MGGAREPAGQPADAVSSSAVLHLPCMQSACLKFKSCYPNACARKEIAIIMLGRLYTHGTAVAQSYCSCSCNAVDVAMRQLRQLAAATNDVDAAFVVTVAAAHAAADAAASCCRRSVRDSFLTGGLPDRWGNLQQLRKL